MSRFSALLTVPLLAALLVGAAVSCSEGRTVVGSADIQKMVDKARGKVVILNFFASWCPPCRAEIPDLVELRKAVGEDRLLLVGLSVDEDPAALEAFLKKTPVNYPVFRASDEASTAFRVQSIPMTLIYDTKGGLFFSRPGVFHRAMLEGIVRQLTSK